MADRLRPYGAALKTLGVEAFQVCGRWLNNRAGISHQPFRRREGAMARIPDLEALLMFAAIRAPIHNFFNL